MFLLLLKRLVLPGRIYISKTRPPARVRIMVLLASLLYAAFLSQNAHGLDLLPSTAIQLPPSCPLGTPTVVDGRRPLALLVGIGDYAAPQVSDLAGPPNDVAGMVAILTSQYGFPSANVCVLTNAQATTARFKEAFEKTLVARAKAGDPVVFFYAGHGSQTRDLNGDEPDEWDETLVLQDSRTQSIRDLTDDSLNEMLARLYAKTENVTVVLDSCNSGSASRDGLLKARFQPADETRDATVYTAKFPAVGDGGAAVGPASMPGMVVLSAAADGTSALEVDGRGIFTSALIEVLGTPDSARPTYAQLARQLPPRVAARSAQIPYFQGALDKEVFGTRQLSRCAAWQITEVKDARISLRGVAGPGWGIGSEVSVFAGNSSPDQIKDPRRIRGVLEVLSTDGITATARPLGSESARARLQIGDLAVLSAWSPSAMTLKIRARPTQKPGGVEADRLAAVKQVLAKDKDIDAMVAWTPDLGAFELSANAAGYLQLIGPEGHIRNTFAVPRSEEMKSVAEALARHARQQVLLTLRGETGADFANDQTLQVQVVPAATQESCAKGEWVQAPPNQEQVIPLCHQWQIKVSLSETAPTRLLVGGVLLTNDGGIYGFPTDGSTPRLEPGRHLVFSDFRVQAEPPLDARDHILVFGTREQEPVQWNLLTNPATTRDGESRGGLARALSRVLSPGLRGGAIRISTEALTWTSTYLPTRVEANSRFLDAPPNASTVIKREYTIPSFDIRPYLPDSTDTALSQVLRKADWLAKASSSDGIRYRQHDWSQGSDAANLKLGIDCSRAIWFAFSRAGLPYSHKNQTIATAQMVGANSPMAEHFDRCDSDPPELGDVLVYRDEGRKVGHVVMVIDREKRIAWGSHGWDGNVLDQDQNPGLSSDTGVEYQKIKYKKDWERWDRKTMIRAACWRYRRFAREGEQPGGQPGSAALVDACLPARCAPGSAQ